MEKKYTAFGSGNDYQHYKTIGRKIAESEDGLALTNQIKLLFSDQRIEQQRAAAVCLQISDTNPVMFEPHIGNLARLISPNSDKHPSVYRTVFRLLSMINLPENNVGEIVDSAFHFLADHKQPIAIKVFAMTVISNQAVHYPELANELSLVLQNQWKTGSAGFRNRAEKIAKKHGFSLHA